MSDIKETKAKLQVIKEMAPEASVKQVCDVLINYLNDGDKKPIGFEPKKDE